MLVDILLRELCVCSGLDTPKPYLAALCRVASTLEVFPVGETEGGVRVWLRASSLQDWLPDWCTVWLHACLLNFSLHQV